MSYDADMVVDTGAEYPASVEYMGNYTWNVAPMYKLAFEQCKLPYTSLHDLNGMTGEEVGDVLGKVIAQMTRPKYVAQYQALNPMNGWGNWSGAVRFLRNIQEAAVKHNKAKLSIT